jgi:hypothetical protein
LFSGLVFVFFNIRSLTNYQACEPQEAFAGADRRDFYPVKLPAMNPVNFQLPIPQKARMRGRPYRYVFIVVSFINRLTLSTANVTVIWRCGERARMRRRTI